VYKITNSKHQKTNKLQITSTPPKRRRAGKFQINHKFQVSRQKDGGQANSKQGLKLFFYSFVCYLFFRSRAAQALAPRVGIYLLFVFCYLGFPLVIVIYL